MRSITKLDLQYAHRFYGFKGEAQYLHGHTGVLTIEVEDTVEPGVNMVFPCNEIQKTAWEVLKNKYPLLPPSNQSFRVFTVSESFDFQALFVSSASFYRCTDQSNQEGASLLISQFHTGPRAIKALREYRFFGCLLYIDGALRLP